MTSSLAPAGSITPRPVVVIDTREQRPLEFPGYLTVARALPAGDYSMVGWEHVIGFERKSFADLIGSCSSTPVPDRPDRKSKRELFLDAEDSEIARVAALPYGALVLECTADEILHRPYKYSQMNRSAVLATCYAIEMRHCRVVFAGSRERAAKWIVGRCELALRYLPLKASPQPD